MVVYSFLFVKTASLEEGGYPMVAPRTDPPSICHIAAEPTRQPTTKRRKRKNSTSSTSNSSAGTNANSTGSKKKTPAANLSLSSQVPVSLTFLLGLKSRLCLTFHCGWQGGHIKVSFSCKYILGRPGWGKERQGQCRDGREETLPWKTYPANWELERNIKSLCCNGT